jgi:hypothetical protein
MLTFILSMRARALAKDWGYHTWLLERTLDSILAQTNSRFDVVVVCHDIPEVAQANHEAVHMLPVDFEPPQRNHHDMCVDKVRKISEGVKWAIARNSDYVVFMDADDLVSRRLSEFVAAHHGDNGWYFDNGYAYRHGQRWIREHEFHHLICGTAAIVRTDLLSFAPSDFCGAENVNTLAAAGHGQYRAVLEAQGAPLGKLPFFGSVYILHEDATSGVPAANSVRPHIPRWRRVLTWSRRTLPKMRPLTPTLRAEFSIPKADAVRQN